MLVLFVSIQQLIIFSVQYFSPASIYNIKVERSNCFVIFTRCSLANLTNPVNASPVKLH